MKRLFLLIATLLITITLAACGTQDNANDTNQSDEGTMNSEDQNNKDDTTDQVDDENMNNEDNETDAASDEDMKQKMDELDYTDFELELDYGKNKEYEAEIKQENGKIQADLKDEINGVDLNGEEAFNKIHPKVKKLTIEANISKDDAIKEALKVFDLDPDYNKFELELTFKDGKKIEFEDKK